MVSDHLFATVEKTPAAQSLRQRLEKGRALSCGGISAGAQSFLAVLLRHLFPQRPLVVVTEGVKAQESLQQDIETWLRFRQSEEPEASTSASRPRSDSPATEAGQSLATRLSPPLFYPAWEILPHEAKLPHADVISERLETLVALANAASAERRTRNAEPLVVTNVVALLQKTFPAEVIRERMRIFRRGDGIDPTDLAEWLEEQGYEPEVKVNHKGEMSLRGGILDIFPLTSPWPVRLEFFGDELDSLRYFDPITQVSRETIGEITVPPAGELGILKRLIQNPESATRNTQHATRNTSSLATLLDYLPPETIFIFCEPKALEQQARNCGETIPEDDPFFVLWPEFQAELQSKGATVLSVSEGTDANLEALSSEREADLVFSLGSLDAFRPIVERAPEPQVARGAASRVLYPTASLDAPGSCGARLLQQRGRTATVRRDLG